MMSYFQVCVSCQGRHVLQLHHCDVRDVPEEHRGHEPRPEPRDGRVRRLGHGQPQLPHLDRVSVENYRGPDVPQG